MLGDELEIIAPAIRAKIRQKAEDGLKQLHAAELDMVERRVLGIRWELPYYEMLRPVGVAEVLHADMEQLMEESRRRAEILIFTDHSIEMDTVST
jgi:hypothetical protein